MLILAFAMFTSVAIDFFGSKARIAEILDITLQAVSQWGELVPPLSASRLAVASNGALEFDPSLYESWNKQTKKAS